MRKWFIIALVCCCACAKAQEQNNLLVPDTTFSLPPLTYRGTIATYPYLGWYTGFSNWELHPGLNASFSASAIFGFGRNSGSGLANSAAVMYAGQLMPKLSFSIGGYTSFLEYSSHQMKDAGLTAMLNYRFDEHWEAGVFAQKSMMQPKMPLQQMWWLGSDFGDKIGAMVKYNINPHFSVQLSVWDQRNPRYDRWQR